MAFTSKVVILLLVSSLAWWQAYAQWDSAKTIIQGIKNITTMADALTTKVQGITDENIEFEGPVVVQGIKDITNTLVQTNNTLQMVLAQDKLSPKYNSLVAQAFLDYLFAQELLLRALVAHDTPTKLKRFAIPVIEALESLRAVAVDTYLILQRYSIIRDTRDRLRIFYVLFTNVIDKYLMLY